ncbi:hypothetical protein LOTGIDRAFT_230002 [Lottia gigantea]|uniref:Immunoglobulin domain-containing protein n=1 Tax=Lottia gigantea TaxID=225164 RepID=V4B3J7_LOTGI|nr:hypothetical protein LOTGIDRAFT_230002 [Lottia gigantea]ESP04933.1 hypothetical protein LOTGIDRAFT_230002 [Lottia gigantea]
MKSIVVVICLGLLLVNLARSASHDFPNITGKDPLDITRPLKAELTCHVAKLNESIAWIYNDTTFFSCDFPYSVGTCVNIFGHPYDFTINQRKNTFVAKYTIKENVNDGNWTCRHGNDTSHPYMYDTGKSPEKPTITISNMKPSEGENITITCTMPESDTELTKYDMQMSDGSNKVDLINIKDPTNLTYTYTLTTGCRTISYSCSVYNRFGFNYADRKITADCLIEFREDLTPTNVTAYEENRSVELTFYYTGRPFPPKYQWYRLENGTEKNLTDYRNSPTAGTQCNPNGTACILLQIYNPTVVDSGYFIVYVNETKTGLIKSHTFYLNVLPAKSEVEESSTTANQMPCSAPSSDELTFGQGIGVGIGIGLVAVIFIAGGIYGCRKA